MFSSVGFHPISQTEISLTQVTIQLADRSAKVPKGEITYVLIRIGEFIYPVDFTFLET